MAWPKAVLSTNERKTQTMKKTLLVALAALALLSVTGPSFGNNKKANFIAKTCEPTTSNVMKCSELVANKKK